MTDKADTVLIGGDIQTMDSLLPSAEAVAVKNGRVLAVGSDDDIGSLIGPDTGTVHLNGNLTLPGFMDSHIHFALWSLGLGRLELSGAASFGRFLSLIDDFAGRKEKGDWVLGQGWNEAEWPENRQPTREDLDRVAPDHPVLLYRCDLHMAAANSKALGIAGIDERSPDPPQGRIERDDKGRPNGLLRESAMDLVADRVPRPTDDELTDAFLHGRDIMHQAGVTTLCDVPLMHDAEDWDQGLRVWRRLEAEGRLALRVWHCVAKDRLAHAIDAGLKTGAGSDLLRTGPVKFFADGGMGARTAWVLEPYRDGGIGMPLMDMARLEHEVRLAEQAGLSVMIHAIGDRAAREVIEIYRGSPGPGKPGGPPIPHRVEHLQMVQAEDLAKLKELPIAVCMQPPNMMIDMNLVDECLGERGQWVYSFGNVQKSGVPMAFSSDAPVCDHRPLTGIHGAVNRTTVNGTPEGGWHPGQKITVRQAATAYTATPAKMCGADDRFGSITPGKLADITVLNRNIFQIPTETIAQTQVALTMFNGTITYRKI